MLYWSADVAFSSFHFSDRKMQTNRKRESNRGILFLCPSLRILVHFFPSSILLKVPSSFQFGDYVFVSLPFPSSLLRPFLSFPRFFRPSLLLSDPETFSLCLIWIRFHLSRFVDPAATHSSLLRSFCSRLSSSFHPSPPPPFLPPTWCVSFSILSSKSLMSDAGFGEKRERSIPSIDRRQRWNTESRETDAAMFHPSILSPVPLIIAESADRDREIREINNKDTSWEAPPFVFS